MASLLFVMSYFNQFLFIEKIENQIKNTPKTTTEIGIVMVCQSP